MLSSHLYRALFLSFLVFGLISCTGETSDNAASVFSDFVVDEPIVNDPEPEPVVVVVVVVPEPEPEPEPIVVVPEPEPEPEPVVNEPAPTDNTLPTVNTVTPSNNTTNVSPDLARIEVNFSEAMDANSINGSTFTLDNGLTGTISTNGDNTRAVFIPNETLSRDTTYTATIDGATDVAGNSLQSNDLQTYSWSFSTCGSTPSSTYTVAWDAVNDDDLTGYRVYYGKTSSLTKANATSVDLGDVTSWDLNPASLDLKPCDTVYVAVTAIGATKAESGLSDFVNEAIN